MRARTHTHTHTHTHTRVHACFPCCPHLPAFELRLAITARLATALPSPPTSCTPFCRTEHFVGPSAPLRTHPGSSPSDGSSPGCSPAQPHPQLEGSTSDADAAFFDARSDFSRASSMLSEAMSLSAPGSGGGDALGRLRSSTSIRMRGRAPAAAALAGLQGGASGRAAQGGSSSSSSSSSNGSSNSVGGGGGLEGCGGGADGTGPLVSLAFTQWNTDSAKWVRVS